MGPFLGRTIQASIGLVIFLFSFILIKPVGETRAEHPRKDLFTMAEKKDGEVREAKKIQIADEIIPLPTMKCDSIFAYAIRQSSPITIHNTLVGAT